MAIDCAIGDDKFGIKTILNFHNDNHRADSHDNIDISAFSF